MKTEKTIRNIKRAVSDGEQITGHTQSEDGDSQEQQILIVGGERDSSGRGCTHTHTVWTGEPGGL